MHVSKVMLCIKKRDERKEGRTDERARSNLPLQLLRSWGHNNGNKKKNPRRSASEEFFFFFFNFYFDIL